MGSLRGSWRLLWLVPTALLFAGSAHQFIEHRAVLARIARSRLPRAKAPLTSYSKHTGMALACLGLGFVILAFHRPEAADTRKPRGGSLGSTQSFTPPSNLEFFSGTLP